MRGVGKGLIGAVVEPTAGVLDLASDVSSGIMSSTTMSHAVKQRVRPPRAAMYDEDACLEP